MQDDSSRNTIIFLVCALALFIVYQVFVTGPAEKKHQAELAHQKAVAAQKAGYFDAEMLSVKRVEPKKSSVSKNGPSQCTLAAGAPAASGKKASTQGVARGR